MDNFKKFRIGTLRKNLRKLKIWQLKKCLYLYIFKVNFKWSNVNIIILLLLVCLNKIIYYLKHIKLVIFKHQYSNTLIFMSGKNVGQNINLNLYCITHVVYGFFMLSL